MSTSFRFFREALTLSSMFTLNAMSVLIYALQTTVFATIRQSSTMSSVSLAATLLRKCLRAAEFMTARFSPSSTFYA